MPRQAEGEHRQPARITCEWDSVAEDSNSKNAVIYLSLILTMNSTSNVKNKTKVVFVLFYFFVFLKDQFFTPYLPKIRQWATEPFSNRWQHIVSERNTWNRDWGVSILQRCLR